MKVCRKIIVTGLSLICLYNIAYVGSICSGCFLVCQASAQEIDTLTNNKAYNIRLDKNKFNDLNDSITIPDTLDILELDKSYYPNLNSNSPDLSDIDILTLDKLKAKLEPVTRKKRKGVQIENIPEIYEIDLSSIREASKGGINLINLKAKNKNRVETIGYKTPSNSGKSIVKTINSLDKALELIKSGQTVRATAMMDSVAATYKNDPWMLAQIAEVYEYLKNYNKTQKLYERAVTLNPGRIELLFNYANFLYRQNKYDKSEKYLRKIISMNPEFTLAYYSLGLLKFKQKQYYNALEYFNKAISLNPLSADSYYNAALILELIGKPDLALKYYNKCLELEPADSQAMLAVKRLSVKKNKK